MDTKKKQNPEQARREANTQQLTELKYLKTQIAAKDARIKELEAKLVDALTIRAEVVRAAKLNLDPVLEQIKSDAEGQRPGKFQA